MTRRLVTVFGGSGFIGRHLVQRLAATGAVIRIAIRYREDAHFLKTMGDVGQITTLETDIADPEEIRRAAEGADWVVNLVGIFHPRGRHTFENLHAKAPGEIAAAAKAAGASRFVHISAMGATADAESAYARTKAEGEAAVFAAFPEATIVRPSVVFGPEDNFFNLFARMATFSPFLPVIDKNAWSFGGKGLFGDGGPKFQPVYVGDVADAILAALKSAAHGGKTYELGGPHVYSMRQIMEMTLAEIRRERRLLPMTFGMARCQAALMRLMPKPLLTRDQVLMMMRDNVVSGSCPGFAELGIEPTTAETILPTYLNRFRKDHRQIIKR
ncbi:complex I NDUFA9 subunit family protein [Oleispirillum naphthae]|uniref:complex I NDUFA9 subunit family protein n=1 Tax=Oleispirillum naphthae TaxID=2838853 RepID=UPI0030823A9B